MTEQALDQLAELIANKIAGKTKDGRSLPLGELFDDYLNVYAKARCRSWRNMEALYRRYLSRWNDRDTSSIGKHEVRTLHAELAQNVGRTSANRAIELLCMIYNYGIDCDLISCPNPAARIKKFKLQSRERFLDASEIERFRDAVQSLRSEITQNFIWMCLFTGVRRGNVAAMRWDEVSLERAVWRVPTTKNGRSQFVALTPFAMAVLMKSKQLAGDSPWVFPSDRSATGYLTKVENAWQIIREKADLGDLRLHDLRRSLASWEAITGANLSVIAATLNHLDLKSTAIYARLNVEPIREAMTVATKAMFSSAGLPAEAQITRTDDPKLQSFHPVYCFRKRGDSWLVVQHEREILGKINYLRSGGMSIQEIAKTLNGEGLTRRGRWWQNCNVEYLIRTTPQIEDLIKQLEAR